MTTYSTSASSSQQEINRLPTFSGSLYPSAPRSALEHMYSVFAEFEGVLSTGGYLTDAPFDANEIEPDWLDGSDYADDFQCEAYKEEREAYLKEEERRRQFVLANLGEPMQKWQAKKPICSKLRWKIFKRDGYRCCDCLTDEDLTIDHIFPESLGGPTIIENLQTLCRSCNSSKGNR